jgi:hypothetical protein
MNEQTCKFQVGDMVKKIGGNYTATGTIAAAWIEPKKGPRYVFRFYIPAGMLQILNEDQLELMK